MPVEWLAFGQKMQRERLRSTIIDMLMADLFRRWVFTGFYFLLCTVCQSLYSGQIPFVVFVMKKKGRGELGERGKEETRDRGKELLLNAAWLPWEIAQISLAIFFSFGKEMMAMPLREN